MNKSWIFSSLSIAGFITTTVLVIKETIKFKDEIPENYPELPKKEKAKKIFKTYAPAMVMGTVTIASMITNDYCNTKQKNVMAQSYILLSESYNHLKKNLRDNLSIRDYDNLMNDILDDEHKLDELRTAEIPKNHSADQYLYYDRISNRYFWRTDDAIIEAEYQLNKLFNQHGCVSLNDFYILLGLPTLQEFKDYGWSSLNYSSSCWIDFDHVLYPLDDDEDLPDFILIEPFIEPVKDYKYL